MDAVDAVTAACAAQQHDDDDLSALELADGLLENVVRCPDCAKPVLPSALEDHAGAAHVHDLTASFRLARMRGRCLIR